MGFNSASFDPALIATNSDAASSAFAEADAASSAAASASSKIAAQSAAWEAGGGLNWSLLSASSNAAVDTGYLIKASAAAVTLTLPADPSEGDTIGVCDIYEKATTNTITIARNTKNIEGAAEDLVIDIDGAGLTLTYTDATIGWKITSEIGGGAGTIKRYIQIRLIDKDTSHTVADGIGGEFRLKVAMTVLSVGAYFDAAGAGSVTTVEIFEAGSTILSTDISVDATEKTSETAATPAVISDSAIAADGILTFNISGIASGTAGKGLVIWMEVTIP